MLEDFEASLQIRIATAMAAIEARIQERTAFLLAAMQQERALLRAPEE